MQAVAPSVRVLERGEHRGVFGTQPLIQRTRGVNHARRQQYRRLSRAGRLGLAGTAVAVLGLFAVRTGAAFAGALFWIGSYSLESDIERASRLDADSASGP